MARRKVYISLGEWIYKRKNQEPYTGYVVNLGYAYLQIVPLTQAHIEDQTQRALRKVTPSVGREYQYGVWEYGIVYEQHLDISEEAVLESIPEAVPAHTPGTTKWNERKYFLNHPLLAIEIGWKWGTTNITRNAVRFSTRNDILVQDKEMDDGDGNEVNAFRHVIWQSYLTNKYGYQTALAVGNAHEDNRPLNTADRHFTTLSDADMVIDLLNNEIGKELGSTAPKNTPMNKMALLVLDVFYQDGLFTAVPTGNGTFYVDRTTITDEQYEELKQIFSNLNRFGRLPEEQEKQDKIEKEKLQQLEATWGTMK